MDVHFRVGILGPGAMAGRSLPAQHHSGSTAQGRTSRPFDRLWSMFLTWQVQPANRGPPGPGEKFGRAKASGGEREWSRAYGLRPVAPAASTRAQPLCLGVENRPGFRLREPAPGTPTTTPSESLDRRRGSSGWPRAARQNEDRAAYHTPCLLPQIDAALTGKGLGGLLAVGNQPKQVGTARSCSRKDGRSHTRP